MLTAAAIISCTIGFLFLCLVLMEFMKAYLELKCEMARIEYMNRILGCIQAAEYLDEPLSKELSEWAEKELKGFLEEEKAKKEEQTSKVV